MNYFEIEFMSKDGYKTRCVVPAVDKKSAKNKFVKIQQLVHKDTHPVISNIIDLGDLDSKVSNKKFSDRVDEIFK